MVSRRAAVGRGRHRRAPAPEPREVRMQNWEVRSSVSSAMETPLRLDSLLHIRWGNVAEGRMRCLRESGEKFRGEVSSWCEV